MSIIYCHKNKINGKCYIGQTSRTLKIRCRHDGSGYASSRKFWMAIKKYGWDNFEHIVLCECTEDLADELEQKYIIEYDSIENGYNLESGGGTTKHLSDETKKKIGQANSIALKGRHLSDETKRKLSEANRGEKNGFFGKKHTVETKKKLSAIHKGKSLWGGHRTDSVKQKISKTKCLKIICVETRKIFNSILEATELTGINNISRAIATGICAGGYHWKKLEKEKDNE